MTTAICWYVATHAMISTQTCLSLLNPCLARREPLHIQLVAWWGQHSAEIMQSNVYTAWDSPRAVLLAWRYQDGCGAAVGLLVGLALSWRARS